MPSRAVSLIRHKEAYTFNPPSVSKMKAQSMVFRTLFDSVSNGR